MLMFPLKLFVVKVPRDEDRGDPPVLKNNCLPPLSSTVDSHDVLSTFHYRDGIISLRYVEKLCLALLDSL